VVSTTGQRVTKCPSVSVPSVRILGGRSPTERRRMREEKEIREALKKLKDEHLRGMRQPRVFSIIGMLTLVAMVDTLEWVLGDKERLPDFV